MAETATPENEELGRFLSLYNRETDRGAALTACAHFDSILERMLAAYLLPGEQTNDLLQAGITAPLGSLRARVAMCRALGLLQANEYEELTLMRRIRNKFSHNLECGSFDHESVRDLVDLLPWLGPDPPDDVDRESWEKNRRSRFNVAATILAFDLMYRERLVRREPVRDRTWPNKSRSN